MNQLTRTDEQLPAYIKQDSNRGSENVGTGDVQYPRIDIIQDLSPEHKENKPEYIEGAKVGMLFNVLTRELYPDGVYAVPVYFEKQWLVWKDQNKGGGLQGVFDNERDAQMRADEDEDFECVETPTHVVLLTDEAGDFLMEATIPMSKSKMKVNRQWNSIIRLAGGDRFSRRYHITSIEDQNAEGQDYLNYKVLPAGFPSEEVYLGAEALYEAITSGAVKPVASYSDQTGGDEAAEGGEPPAEDDY